ncbi:MAG: hypothetical protein AB7P02_00125 [Alphaproteobacteria bacterium]
MVLAMLVVMAVALGGRAAHAVDGGAGHGPTGTGSDPQADYVITLRNEAWATVSAKFSVSGQWTPGREAIGGQSIAMEFRDSIYSLFHYQVHAYTGSSWRQVCSGYLGNVLRWDGDRRVATLKVQGAFFPADHWNCNGE